MTIRLGGGQGFYGDGHDPVGDLLDAGVDYLVCEALAELTLAILQKDRQRDEALGWTRDLPLYVHQALPWLVDGRTRLITNAGGINPVAAGRAVVDALRGSGRRRAEGGDRRRRRRARAATPSSGCPRTRCSPTPTSGRARSSTRSTPEPTSSSPVGWPTLSLFLAPLVHEHGWTWDDWDRLAAGVVVGHLLECSGQVTGGNYSGPWWENADPTRIGFPIAEVDADGSAVITKPARDGRPGLVRHRPRAAPLRGPRPGVVSQPRRDRRLHVAATSNDLGDDRVRVSGARVRLLRRPTRASCAHRPAGPGEARFAYSWPDAEAKARAALAFIRRPCRAAGPGGRGVARGVLRRRRVRRSDGRGGSAAADAAGWEPPEVIGRLAWRCADATVAGEVAQGVGVLGLSGPPTIAGTGRSRDGKPTQLLAVEPFAVDRGLVDAQVRVDVTESETWADRAGVSPHGIVAAGRRPSARSGRRLPRGRTLRLWRCPCDHRRSGPSSLQGAHDGRDDVAVAAQRHVAALRRPGRCNSSSAGLDRRALRQCLAHARP